MAERAKNLPASLHQIGSDNEFADIASIRFANLERFAEPYTSPPNLLYY